MPFRVGMDHNFCTQKGRRQLFLHLVHHLMCVGNGHGRINPDVELDKIMGAACPGAKVVNALQFGMLARPEEHTSELQSLMRISYAVFCLKKKNNDIKKIKDTIDSKSYTLKPKS